MYARPSPSITIFKCGSYDLRTYDLDMSQYIKIFINIVRSRNVLLGMWNWHMNINVLGNLDKNKYG
jgi:hypothetical protein